ncbi:membrane protein insertase [endosymbiont of Acanthamoeba sp. UWC8]|uniref:membrane protein insertase YidC n=1 Tax=endosymbiont of Acanthamoeba sp. UWC8 TaxID=86106 RepID=UPI0004D13320|nr:membrane protein insertase YidC [endosymbiont of Acanthamoeba sp. UWC8]AIF81874.1 membrane protein insertase [endosymbiont of Acanthamoeba sp. UWC8]
MSDQQRLTIAVILSVLIVFTWQYFFAPPPPPPPSAFEQKSGTAEITPDLEEANLSQEEIVKEGFKNNTRVLINNQAVKGSINLVGARIDDLTLLQYKVHPNANDANVVLFSPSKTREVYFAEFGWISNEENLELPNKETLWKANKASLKQNDNISLSWTNSQNIEFIITISLDENFMFDIKQETKNQSDKPIKIQPYSLISRSHIESKDKNMIIHEGAIGVFNNSLKEVSFEDLSSERKLKYENNINWLGFSDKYWLAAIIPGQDQVRRGSFIAFKDGDLERFQADIIQNTLEVKSNASAVQNVKLFAGAKKLDLLDKYQAQYNITLFDRAVDFGILYFITKPIFILLSYFYKMIGNFGLAILLLTVVIKLMLFPLAYKGFRGMNKLKDLQPQMQALKQKHQDDTMMFQKSIMELYKKEKVNPLAGCLPIVLQMPIFFALYKVLYVTIEMRHAHFFGWIKDLSGADTTNIFNLFGLIPWDPPAFLHIGILPILMAATMYIQQRLSPEPSDPMQAKVMKMLPWIFMFMFSTFPSGLIIYWAWSNILSIVQQVAIKKLDTKKA